MVEWLLFSVAVGLGMSLPRVTALIAATRFPFLMAVLIAGHVWRNKRHVSTRSLAFCEAVADELRSGASLRFSLQSAARSVEADSLAARVVDAPFRVVAGMTAEEFPDVGPELAVCIERSAWSGAPIADLFDELAGVALAQFEVQQELRAALAPARATALVMLAGPLIVLWKMFGSEDRAGFLVSPAQRLAFVTGLLLVVVSFAAGAVMVRRSR